MTTSGLRVRWTIPQVHSRRRSVRPIPTKRPPFHHGRSRPRFIKPCKALDSNGEGSELDAPGDPRSDQGDMSTNEWNAMQRVCDKLFPKGAIEWEQFWMNDDFEEWYDDWQQCLQEERSLDPSLPHYEESIDGQRAWLQKATSYLSTRSDYATMLPYNYTEAIREESEPNYAKEFDPDWDDWDFRAMMEKRRAREKLRRNWRRKQQDIGFDEHIDTAAIDKRISEEDREGYNWTEEEVWDIITQKGRAADPRKIKKLPWRELSLDELPDWAGEGHTYVEEIDEYMMNQNLMIDDKKQLNQTSADLELKSKLPDIDSLFQEYSIEEEFAGEG